MLIEEFISDPSVETLDRRILGWFPGVNEVQSHVAFRCPFQERVGEEFGPIVRSENLGIATLKNALTAAFRCEGSSRFFR